MTFPSLDGVENDILKAKYSKKKVPNTLMTSWIMGYFIKVEINTKLIKITNAV